MKTVSLVVPCYNEEKVLERYYRETSMVINSIEDYEFEFIFVDDGSKDDTLKLMQRLSEKDERVHYVSFSRNFGKEAGLMAGLEYAKGDLVGVMDSDLQDPPSLIPDMLKELENDEVDCVATRRVDRKGEPPIRSFFARMFYQMINKMSSTDIVDGARDYRIMKRCMVDAIIALPEYHRFSKGIFGWVGFNTKWLEFENIERADGETKWSFWKLFAYAIEGIVGFTTIPLRFATLIGVLVSFVAFCYLLFIVIKTWIHLDVPGYASTMAVILFLGGLTMLALGVLGEYVAKIYMETKRRPLYIVKRSDIKKHERNS